MKTVAPFLFLFFLFACQSVPEKDIPAYHQLINEAELYICDGGYSEALSKYDLAFAKIDKPFGKDLHNAALASYLIGNKTRGNEYLQQIINNSDDLDKVKEKIVGFHLTEEEWQQLLAKRVIAYDPALRQEFKEIRERDQLFRPLYDTHDDTINANRIINMNRILELTEKQGFPAHQELGYQRYLRGQKHNIVLHHTAQRRSYDKSVTDLEPILFQAIQEGRFDPETAIIYMNYQNDQEKGRFQVFSTWQYKHPLLADSLNDKIWIPMLDEQEQQEANAIRKKWYANSLEDLARKSFFLNQNNPPFIFTGVQKSIGHFREDISLEKALEQYEIATMMKEEYQPKQSPDEN